MKRDRFTNREDIDFSNASSVKAVQEWDIHPDTKGEHEYPTRSVHCRHFVCNSTNSCHSTIDSVLFFLRIQRDILKNFQKIIAHKLSMKFQKGFLFCVCGVINIFIVKISAKISYYQIHKNQDCPFWECIEYNDIHSPKLRRRHHKNFLPWSERRFHPSGKYPFTSLQNIKIQDCSLYFHTN